MLSAPGYRLSGEGHSWGMGEIGFPGAGEPLCTPTSSQAKIMFLPKRGSTQEPRRQLPPPSELDPALLLPGRPKSCLPTLRHQTDPAGEADSPVTSPRRASPPRHPYRWPSLVHLLLGRLHHCSSSFPMTSAVVPNPLERQHRGG